MSILSQILTPYRAAREFFNSLLGHFRYDWSMENYDLISDPQQLLKLAQYRMPFGKYANRLLIDLPEPYVVWFAKQGFPKGELGRLLRIVYEVKVNGLEYLFEPLRPQKSDK